jgi:hypothetical protein
MPSADARLTPHGPNPWAARQTQLSGHSKAVAGVEVEVMLVRGLQVSADTIAVAYLQYRPQHG